MQWLGSEESNNNSNSNISNNNNSNLRSTFRMRSSNDIEADESMRLLGVDNGSALQAEDDVEAFENGDEVSLSSSSSALSGTKIMAAAVSLAAACAVMAFSGNDLVGQGLSSMSFAVKPAVTAKAPAPATTDGAARLTALKSPISATRLPANFRADKDMLQKDVMDYSNFVTPDAIHQGAGVKSDMEEQKIYTEAKQLKEQEKLDAKELKTKTKILKKMGNFDKVDAKAQLANATKHDEKVRASGAKKLGREGQAMSVNQDALPGGFRMMSLSGATAESSFEACSSSYEHGNANFYYKVETGCIAIFNNDISKYAVSQVITFCGCETIGPKMYDFVALQNAGLISKAGAGLISFIATGDMASITIYNEPDFSGDEHYVIGPMTQIPMDRVRRGESTWDNAIYSMVMQAWCGCDLEPVVCAPLITQAPVAAPTLSPFINPTARPSRAPVIPPTTEPTKSPTPNPTTAPRARPTMEPLARPTLFPTQDPTKNPLAVPTRFPTNHPNAEPSHFPTEAPIVTDPTFMPTMAPTMDERIVICKGTTAEDSNIVVGTTYPKNGCASFFWSAPTGLTDTMVSTICTCGEVGQVDIPNSLMEVVGAAAEDGFPTISTIITGFNVSLTIYAPYWTDIVEGIDKYVVGEHEVADLTEIERSSGSGVWNDKVKSISMMAWTECAQHAFGDSCIDF